MTATHWVGLTSWKKGRPGMVRCVGPVGIGANGIVSTVTDVPMACFCPVNDAAGGYKRLSEGGKQASLCAFSICLIVYLPTIPPPCCFRQFPFVFVLSVVLRLFHCGWGNWVHVRDVITFGMKARPPFHLRDGVCDQAIA